MGDALAILGIYLTLGTLLVTTFFARLESWYGTTKEVSLAWSHRTLSGMSAAERTRHQDRYHRARESMPWKSGIFVSVLLSVLSFYAVKIGNRIDDPSVPLSYLWVPGGVCLVGAIIASLALFIRGIRTLDNVEVELKMAQILPA